MLTNAKRAFSVTELLVVLGGFGLLTTFVLPLPQRIQQHQRLTGCLGNLAQIGAASLAYATQDSRQLLVPMHAADVTTLSTMGWAGTDYGWRTAAKHTFGGQTATTAFPVEGTQVTAMLDSYWGEAPNPWGASTRPLNDFIAAAGGNLQTFHCPADTGYPATLAPTDVDAAAVGTPCFDLLGNSYRTNTCGVVFMGTYPAAALSTAPFGHASEYVLEPSRTVSYCDPLFYPLVRELSGGGTLDPIVGWHGTLMADNVAYCDGSARLTEIGALQEFSSQDSQDMLLCDPDPSSFLRRGSTWQLDCYPAPGALIMTYSYTTHAASMDPHAGPASCGWPFDHYIVNENPFPPGRAAGQAGPSAAAEQKESRWRRQ